MSSNPSELNTNTTPSTLKEIEPPAEEIEMQNLPLTIYIIIRKDLTKSLDWNTGSIIAQASHACTSALWKYKEHEQVQEYMKSLNSMHKVVLQTKNESSLMDLQILLKEREILHSMWVEQPENIVTCIATIPYRKSQLGDALKKCQLYR